MNEPSPLLSTRENYLKLTTVRERTLAKLGAGRRILARKPQHVTPGDRIAVRLEIVEVGIQLGTVGCREVDGEGRRHIENVVILLADHDELFPVRADQERRERFLVFRVLHQAMGDGPQVGAGTAGQHAGRRHGGHHGCADCKSAGS